MKRFTFILAPLACLLVTMCQRQAAASDAYSDAYRQAQAAGKLLLVTVGVDAPVLADPAKFVVARLPAGAPHVLTGKRLSAHASLDQLGGDGAFVVKFPDGQGRVISILPARCCSADGLLAFVNLPGESITQNALIWAVRMHPECPKSADGPAHVQMMGRATLVAERESRNGASGHPIPWPPGVSEVSTESWPRNVNVVDAAVDLVATWRQSPGHWAEVARKHSGFGFDMRRGFSRLQRGNVWFGTGCFRD